MPLPVPSVLSSSCTVASNPVMHHTTNVVPVIDLDNLSDEPPSKKVLLSRHGQGTCPFQVCDSINYIRHLSPRSGSASVQWVSSRRSHWLLDSVRSLCNIIAIINTVTCAGSWKFNSHLALKVYVCLIAHLQPSLVRYVVSALSVMTFLVGKYACSSGVLEVVTDTKAVSKPLQY